MVKKSIKIKLLLLVKHKLNHKIKYNNLASCKFQIAN